MQDPEFAAISLLESEEKLSFRQLFLRIDLNKRWLTTPCLPAELALTEY